MKSVKITLYTSGGMKTTVVNSEQLGKVEKFLYSDDQEMKFLGMKIFYGIIKVWENDINFEEFRHTDYIRTCARMRIFNKRYVE